jgi:hypothetical protein
MHNAACEPSNSRLPNPALNAHRRATFKVPWLGRPENTVWAKTCAMPRVNNLLC